MSRVKEQFNGNTGDQSKEWQTISKGNIDHQTQELHVSLGHWSAPCSSVILSHFDAVTTQSNSLFLSRMTELLADDRHKRTSKHDCSQHNSQHVECHELQTVPCTD